MTIKKLHIVDKDVLRLSVQAKNILSLQIKLIGQLLTNVGNKKRDNVSVVGINVLMVGAESISLEIIEGINNGHIITPLLSLRTLFEIYINIHYIFYHPKHLFDVNWADEICKDYITRSCDNNMAKSKLNSLTIAKRANEVERNKEYEIIYTGLCNYNHALMQIVDCGNKKELKIIQIKLVIYSITFLQDCITALFCFFKEKDNGKILNIINKIQELKKFTTSIEI